MLVGAGTATSIEPLLFIILSVASGTAEIVFSTRDFGAGGADGKIWRYSTATLSGPTLAFGFPIGGGKVAERPFEAKWSDANSGNFSGSPNIGNSVAGGGTLAFHHTSFTRLD